MSGRGGETLSGRRTRYSTQPLTLGQLEQFFNGAWSIFHVLAMNFDDYDLARMLGFVGRIESSFYPEIAALYGARIEAWATARRAELDSDEMEVEDRESANSAGSSPAMSKAHNLQSNTFPLTSLHEKDRSQSMSTVLAFKNRERSFPAIENGKVAPPRRVTNLERRSREHLTLTEVERLIASAAKAGRHGSRDAMLILVAFRHGLRVGELVTIRWDQVDLQRGTLHVNRKKNGEAGTHPLSGRELRALRQLKRRRLRPP